MPPLTGTSASTRARWGLPQSGLSADRYASRSRRSLVIQWPTCDQRVVDEVFVSMTVNTVSYSRRCQDVVTLFSVKVAGSCSAFPLLRLNTLMPVERGNAPGRWVPGAFAVFALGGVGSREAARPPHLAPDRRMGSRRLRHPHASTTSVPKQCRSKQHQ